MLCFVSAPARHVPFARRQRAIFARMLSALRAATCLRRARLRHGAYALLPLRGQARDGAFSARDVDACACRVLPFFRYAARARRHLLDFVDTLLITPMLFHIDFADACRRFHTPCRHADHRFMPRDAHGSPLTSRLRAARLFDDG